MVKLDINTRIIRMPSFEVVTINLTFYDNKIIRTRIINYSLEEESRGNDSTGADHAGEITPGARHVISAGDLYDALTMQLSLQPTPGCRR